MRRAVHHWQARSLTCSSADCVSAADLHVGLKLTAVQLFPEMLAQRRLANLKLSGYWVIPKAEALSTRERWASVGTYSAVTLRFQSLNQGTRARYTQSGGGPIIFPSSAFCRAG
jgi:hypothetical protein